MEDHNHNDIDYDTFEGVYAMLHTRMTDIDQELERLEELQDKLLKEREVLARKRRSIFTDLEDELFRKYNTNLTDRESEPVEEENTFDVVRKIADQIR